MLKKLLIAAAVVCAIACIAWLVGIRFAFDGSGRWGRPSRAADFAALEADRERQRKEAGIAAPVGEAVADQGGGFPEQGGRLPLDSPVTAPPPLAPASRVGYWPDFRGPDRDGRYLETSIRTDWPADGLPRLWKQPVGLGYASFVAAGGRAFTIEQRRAKEVVAAYDIKTGRELWTDAWDGEFTETMGGDGPRATPTFDNGRLYALGATGELRCIDANTGALLWRRDILADNGAANLQWGMSASPLVVDNLVIVQPGGSGNRSVVAYDKVSGAPVWHALDDQASYTSPMVVTLAGVRQLLVVTGSRVVGLSIDGRLLWEYPWDTQQGINVSQPILLGDDRVFLSAGYDHGAAVIEVKKNGERVGVTTVWSNNRMKNKFTSSVLRDGFVYGLDEAILACIDTSTGQVKWKGGRYGYGQVLLAGDHLIVLTEEGEVVLVRATPERHVEVARFAAIEGKTWNHPVIVNGTLLVRNLQEMAAFDIRPK